jgi:hypothetical protein
MYVVVGVSATPSILAMGCTLISSKGKVDDERNIIAFIQRSI